jgi:hypothetical protein
MPQVQGVEGEAVVCYAEPLRTQEMRYHRLSRRVNNMAGFSLFVDVTHSEPIKRAHSPQVLPAGSASQAAGLASVYKISPIPYGEDSP